MCLKSLRKVRLRFAPAWEWNLILTLFANDTDHLPAGAQVALPRLFVCYILYTTTKVEFV